MKILLFGATGQLGSACVAALRPLAYELVALDRQQADFAQPQRVLAALQQAEPDILINACAYTAVDQAEADRDLAYQVNSQTLAEIAQWCAPRQVPLLHLSTDYVFDGSAQRPYREDSPVNPLGVYGASKWAGEQAIRQCLAPHIILRTSWVFGERGHNFVRTMLRLGATRPQLRIVADQVGRPTYVGHLVAVLLRLLQTYADTGQLPWGVYHCSSEGQTSWYGFAQAIFQQAQAQGLLQTLPELVPIPTSDYPTPAPRPAYSVLCTRKLSAWLGAPMPHWREGLARWMAAEAGVDFMP